LARQESLKPPGEREQGNQPPAGGGDRLAEPWRNIGWRTVTHSAIVSLAPIGHFGSQGAINML